MNQTIKDILYLLSILGIFSVVSSIILDWIRNRTKIEIEAEKIFNINNFGVIEQVKNVNSLYSNYIYHEISLKSLNDEVITNIELYDIEMIEKQYNDIIFDSGFNEKTQKYILISINNGDKEGFTNCNRVGISIINENLQAEDTCYEDRIEQQLLLSGDIASTLIVNLKDFIYLFDNNKHFKFIKITSFEREKELTKIILAFDRKLKIFRKPPLGADFPQIDEVPLFEIKGDKKSIKNNSNFIIDKGISKVGFTILTVKSCDLRYKVVLYNKKRKITNSEIHRIFCRIPRYKLESTFIEGTVYRMVLDINPEFKEFKYSLEMVSNVNKSLIFDKYAVAKKYSGYKEGEIK